MSVHTQSFSRGFMCVCVCLNVCVQWMRPGDKAKSCYTLYIAVRLRKKKKEKKNHSGYLWQGETMLSKINMEAKSYYQLHNGQATWLRSKQHHPPTQQEDVCMHIYCMCVCVCVCACVRSDLPFIYNLCGCTRVHSCMCVYFWEACACVCTQGALIKGL